MSKVNDERVEIFVPRGNAGEEPNLFISVNGVNYLLPRGKASRVPPHIAEEYYRSMAAQEAMDETIRKMKSQ